MTVLYIIFIAACSVSLVCGLYGALESASVLRRLRNCRYIIIIIIIKSALRFDYVCGVCSYMIMF